jgi:GNAT superfamily N-acetyltransferase
MVIKEIEDIDSSKGKKSLDIYKSYFPPNETRPVEKIVEMLRNDENYRLYGYPNDNDDNDIIGISLMYIFRSLGIGLLDYMAVISDYQRRGFGKKIFDDTFKKFESDMPNGIGLLMEIQREDMPDLQEQESVIRKDRIRFYMRMGAKILDGVNYILPPIQPGFKAEEMYLMIKPVADIHYLPKESVIRYIEAIYSTIYQYPGNDLLNTISQKLPAEIILRN